MKEKLKQKSKKMEMTEERGWLLGEAVVEGAAVEEMEMEMELELEG